MYRQGMFRNILVFLMVSAMGISLASCGPKARPSTNQLDTPEHHTFAGIKLLNQGKYADAQREFDLAVQLAPKYSQAHAGMGLVKAYQGDYKGAFASLKNAGKYAKTDEDNVLFHVGRIRVYAMGMAVADKNWLKEAKDDFDAAVLINPKSSAAYYFMGLAYKAGLDFVQAGQMFRQTLDLAGDYGKEADSEWNLAQKIQRAMPGTVTGKKIAVVERITRADAAALFMEELKIDVLYQKRTPKTFDTAFKDPEKAKTAAKQPATASDIADHTLKADIQGILRIGVRGLENYPDGSFHPNDFVDRATYAMMLEDILIKVTGDNALATRFIGSTSPFPDLRSDLPYFNAVMVVTSRGIMEARNLTSGEFAPLNPVPGVDALLIIRKIKEELKFF
ncbi:MAG: hypothetical protein HY742_04750 [Deltaproteobacteria bacterium]|nr:hypothetical protein [Deltaproteobacteria bacterium]